MEFKKLKYNIVVFFVVVLMVLTVGFKSFSSEEDLGNSDGSGGPVITDPDDGEDNEPQRDDIPSVRQPKQLFAYSWNMFINGKGYESRFTENMTTSINLGITTVNINQSLLSLKKHSGDTYLEQIWMYESSGMGENTYEHTYANCSSGSVEYLECSTFDYKKETVDLNSGSPQIQTVEQRYRYGFSTYEFDMVNENFKTISAKTSDNGKYYLVTIDYKKEAVPESFKAKYYDSGRMAAGSIRFTKDIRFTFYISVKTGKLIQYSRNAEYLTNILSPNINNVLMTSNISEVFQRMDEAFEVARPV